MSKATTFIVAVATVFLGYHQTCQASKAEESKAGVARGGEPLDHDDVVWSTSSSNAAGSMPIGNGDLGLNVWVENNGDLLFYLGKTDAWDENCRLLKLGRVRVKLGPNLSTESPFFKQTLHLRTAEIAIEAGQPKARISLELRVDANHPLVHLHLEGQQAFDVRVDLETWRKQRRRLEGPELHSAYGLDGANPEPVYVEPDMIVPRRKDHLVWYHRNERSIWADNLRRTDLSNLIGEMKDPLLGRTFGAAIEGTGLVQRGDLSLESAAPAKRFEIHVHVLTSQAGSAEQWLEQLDEQIARVQRLDEAEMRTAHRRWWACFWERSWIHLSGTPEAEAVSQGYALQRFVNACGGRGVSPIKFNGSIFNVDDAILVVEPERVPKAYDADYRRWGGPYWFMNTRLIYWPMLSSGDFDLMQPFFRMYLDALPLARARTRIYYRHEGVFFPETIYFWGNYATRNYGWKREGLPVGLPSTRAMQYYWSGGLELSAIMLDYYAHTQDEHFLRDALLPLADGVVTFYDRHYPRDAQGQVHFSPAHALESYWPVVNPMPEIAGLRFVLGELLALPQAATTPAQRATWRRLLDELPPLPTRVADGQTLLSVAQEVGKMYNLENPELYAIFPYRLFGVGKAGLELAQLAFSRRVHKGTGGHSQDAIQAACLGLASEAAGDVIRNFTAAEPSIRFPAFRGLFPNWIPDQNNGSVAMLALQRMLMQTEGRRIRLFPAWPRGWNVDFRLHAPDKTTLQGAYRDGKLVKLGVTPKQRTNDVTVLVPQ
jgi:hypothetical protein